MAINEHLVHTASAAEWAGTGNQEEGLILHLDANDVDSYDGDGGVWYDIKDHEYAPATDVSEHFNTVTYTGNGTTNSTEQSITGVGFQPDLVWIKNRGEIRNHVLVDSLRKTGNLLDELHTNTTDAANTTGTDNVKTMDSDGFTVLGQGSETNDSGDTFVAWCFKAGGAAVSNTDGSITSQVSANNNLGFSIVSYTGNGSNNEEEIGHGLTDKPGIVIIKDIDNTRDWYVYTDLIDGSMDVLYLNKEDAKGDSSRSTPNSSVFYTAGNTTLNKLNQNFIAYCFASKRGISKVGSYTGTGVSGNKVETGFEPAFLMVKRSSTTGDWTIVDNKRPTNIYLRANTNGAEATATTNIIFERDGFSFAGGSFNQSGQTAIYYAVAKNTNETSLIPDTDLELSLDAASFPEKGESGYSNTPSTWTDSSGNSNNGTIAGATFDSELGNYLDFDGINDMVTTSYDIPSVGAKTIEFWFNDNGSSGTNSTYPSPVGGSNAAIWTGGDLTGSYSDESLGFYNADTLLHFYIRTGTNTYRDNKWHHVAITDNGSNQHAVYVDGESHSISYLNGNSGSRISMNNVQIGKGRSTPTTGSYSYYFNGQVGQVRIYSSALTQDQIRQNYNFTKPNYPNGYDGTITNATWNPDGYFNFDGNGDYISLNQGNNMSGGLFNNFSISYWVKLDTTSTTGRHFYAYSSSSNYIILYYNHSLGGMRLGGSNITTQQDSYTMSANTWYHIVVTQSSENVSLYIDTSRKINSNQSIGTYDDMKVTLGAADQNGSITSSLDGKISKFKLYDKILTTTEIDTLHSEGA